MSKLTSRKFILSTAAFLSSVGTIIAGARSDNEVLIIGGIIASILSSAIYTYSEAMIDATAATSKHITIEENVSRETSKEN